jgi:hypothetical protein
MPTSPPAPNTSPLTTVSISPSGPAPPPASRPSRSLHTKAPAPGVLALRDTPPAFKRRNLFTATPGFPVRRPAVSLAARRATNAARQHRFRLANATN